MNEIPNRQKEMDARRLEDVAWREKIRADDRAWREKIRAEELAWREKIRVEDRAERETVTSQDRECLARGLAFIAAAQVAKADTPTKELVRMARDFTQWIGDVPDMKDRGT